MMHPEVTLEDGRGAAWVLTVFAFTYSGEQRGAEEQDYRREV